MPRCSVAHADDGGTVTRVQRAGAVALVAVVLAMASLVQGTGWNQNAHLALVKALSHGTPVIDRDSAGTFDLAYSDGRYYSAKAPGVALLAVGPYYVLDRTRALDAVVRVTGIPREDADLWALAVIVCALAAGITLVLVARLGDEVARGYGIAAAVTLGLATLVLPFSTLSFSPRAWRRRSPSPLSRILWQRRGPVGWHCRRGHAGRRGGHVRVPARARGRRRSALYAIVAGRRIRRGSPTPRASRSVVLPLAALQHCGPSARRSTSRTRTRCPSPASRPTSAASSASRGPAS